MLKSRDEVGKSLMRYVSEAFETDQWDLDGNLKWLRSNLNHLRSLPADDLVIEAIRLVVIIEHKLEAVLREDFKHLQQEYEMAESARSEAADLFQVGAKLKATAEDPLKSELDLIWANLSDDQRTIFDVIRDFQRHSYDDFQVERTDDAIRKRVERIAEKIANGWPGLMLDHSGKEYVQLKRI